VFFRKLNWNVVGWFPIVSTISYVIIFAGIAMMGYNYITKGYFIRLGLSFTGGTDVTVKYQSPTSQVDIQKALATVGVTDAFVNTLGRAGDAQANERFTISTQKAFGNDTAPLWKALNSVAPVDRAQSQIESVYPSLSREYLEKALLALIIAISIQFLYIAFRFGWNYIFGTVVVIALVRDSFMMIGIYALSGRRADDAFLAAVLTVIGYSVMDTIVILDRIRENLRVMPGEAFDRLVNTSIMQTMARSVNTLATVVIVLLALLLFGGGSLQNFAFALLVGIISGGYHSIFYSAPLVVRLTEAKRKRDAARKLASRAAAASGPPRTVAQARAQAAAARAGVTRDDVVAARKERRQKGKVASGGRPGGGPARYKKQRSADAPVARLVDIEPEAEPEAMEEEIVDPLDAQRSGVHDAAYEMGHEEINMDLGDEHAADGTAVGGTTVGDAAKPTEEKAAAKPEG
jgi:preprotein translocase SecF subunit